MFVKVELLKSGLREVGARGLEKKENIHKFA